MKLFRFGEPGSEKPGIFDRSGNPRDLSSVIADITGENLSKASLERLMTLDAARLPLVEEGFRYGPPVANIRKFVAIGLNYADHAIEAGHAIPTEPTIFSKAVTCIQGPNDPVTLPPGSEKGDWEVELGIVIGKTARHVPVDEALGHIAGFLLVNDVSERSYQNERGGSWDKGKGYDTFGPIGPWLVTPDEVGDLGNLDLWLDVNGRRMQTGNTRHMIFDIATVISYTSQFMTLEPGDVLTTGTPPGVGMGMKPEPVYLRAGDVMTLGITGLGEQRQEVRSYGA